MPRKFVSKKSTAPYHVSARSNNKEWFYLPMLQVWHIFQEMLVRISETYGSEIHSFVLMNNHFHLLLSAPQKNLSAAMRYFMCESSRHIGRSADRTNHVFGGRYHPTLLHNASDLAYVYKYIYRNPVRKRICRTVEQYPYSTLRKLLEGQIKIPIVEGFDKRWNLLPKKPDERLTWLNLPTPAEEEELIALALRRGEFKLTSQSRHQSCLKSLRTSYGIPSDPVDNC